MAKDVSKKHQDEKKELKHQGKGPRPDASKKGKKHKKDQRGEPGKAQKHKKKKKGGKPPKSQRPFQRTDLANIGPDDVNLARYRRLVRKDERERELMPYQAELLKLQAHLEKQKRRMIVLFEGRDAAGKGGTIRRVTRYMNEKHYRVVALGKPTEDHLSQWYFQRYVAEFPRGGEIVLFDRSWYNRAMVEPVFGFCTPEEYDNFMRGVVGFEKDLVRHGTVLVKLYFSVSKAEQQRRFDRRRNDPLRQWKLSEIDVQAQDYWDEFTERKYEMLKRTHTASTPWTIIRSEVKHSARLNAMRVVLDSVDYEGRDRGLNFVPDPKLVNSGAREVELMEAERIRRGKFSQ